MEKLQSPDVTVPAIVQDPTEPCPVCCFVPTGGDTPILLRWRRLTIGPREETVYWLSDAGVWICKACHPPGHPDLVKREITIRGVAKREGSRPGTEECAGPNPAAPTMEEFII